MTDIASTLTWQPGPRDAITDVPGIRVGHWSDRRKATGCTVIRCEECLLAAVDVRGGAPGTRETEVLAPANVVRRCHALLFTGGSAFGLAAASGVMRWLAEHEIGFETVARRVPIVPAAVVYDLSVGRADAFPGEAEGYRATAAATAGRVQRGSVGAGTGTIVARLLGTEAAVKGGVGTASLAGPRGLVVGALVVTNAVGNVIDPASGQLLAGPRFEGRMLSPLEAIARHGAAAGVIENTTLVCVATNAVVEHHVLQRMAIQAHDGLARTIVPVHTFGDGDVAFALSMGPIVPEPADILGLGLATTLAVERAVLDSIRQATSLAGVPAVRKLA